MLGTLIPLWGKSAVFVDDLRCMPVQIEIPITTNLFEYGTGMFITRSNNYYFVTAKHCLFDNAGRLLNSNATLTASFKGTNKTERAVGYLDLGWFQSKGLIKFHPTHDIAVILVAFNIDITNSIHHVASKTQGFNFDWNKPVMTPFGDDGCSLFEDVPVGSDSYVLGYPVSLFNGQQSEIDFNFPLVRKGVISQKNYRTKKFIIDSGVYGGNSGGPVVV